MNAKDIARLFLGKPWFFPSKQNSAWLPLVTFITLLSFCWAQPGIVARTGPLSIQIAPVSRLIIALAMSTTALFWPIITNRKNKMPH